MERLLNPDSIDPIERPDINEQVSIPLLDDPFSFGELRHVVTKQINPNKSCGPDGLSPGTLKLLPNLWLSFLLTILDILFISGSYPIVWVCSKLIMLYKKGLPMNCGNYRGISVMNCIAKCYDYLFNNRLVTWHVPCREQAGSQAKRGCIEHIVALRLVIDRCMRKKTPLFIAFIDFSKAYHRVPRNYRLNMLKVLGCGGVMLSAPTSLFWLTQFILGSTIITATLGVKQGSPTSCFLFTLFVDELIQLVKGRSGRAGFLEWLHLLMLMDDTVIFATSRQQLCKKLNVLVEWCDKSGMVINEDKTEFMGFCSLDDEKCPIILHLKHGRVIVTHCNEYTYLGVIFTSDGLLKSSMTRHAISKGKAVEQFNNLKKGVVDACFNASLLYGCEAWLGIKPGRTWCTTLHPE